jgi:hypothetical protein
MGGGSSKGTNNSAKEKGEVDAPEAGDAVTKTAAPVQAFTTATPILEKDGHPNSFHIVILGPGGVGKSTIVKQVLIHSYYCWKIFNNPKETCVSRHSVSSCSN